MDQATTVPPVSVTGEVSSRSATFTKIVSALIKFQGESIPAQKDRENPAFKSNYSTLDALWTVARPLLVKNELAFTQNVEWREGKGLFLRSTLFHVSGEWLESFIPLPAMGNNARNAMQELGSAITYLKRYVMAAMLGLVSENDELDDDGNGAGRNQGRSNQRPPTPPAGTGTPPKGNPPKGQPNTPPAPPADPRANMLKALGANAKKKGWADEQVAAYIAQRYGVPKFANLKIEQCSELISTVGRWDPNVAFNELALAQQAGPPDEPGVTNFETDVPG